MWIRSQNKELLVDVDNFNVIQDDYYYTYAINSGVEDNAYYELGEYKTKERALEVLDEIQKAIEQSQTEETKFSFYGNTAAHNAAKTWRYNKVFQMPKE